MLAAALLLTFMWSINSCAKIISVFLLTINVIYSFVLLLTLQLGLFAFISILRRASFTFNLFEIALINSQSLSQPCDHLQRPTCLVQPRLITLH